MIKMWSAYKAKNNSTIGEISQGEISALNDTLDHMELWVVVRKKEGARWQNITKPVIIKNLKDRLKLNKAGLLQLEMPKDELLIVGSDF